MDRNEQIKKLHADGLTKSEIARKFGLSRERISQIIGKSSTAQKKEEARNITRLGVLRGDIEKQNCSICGDENAEAHHPDYDDPLNVMWLCKKHHREAHHKDAWASAMERKQADRLAHQRMRERMKKFLVQFHASDAETFVRTLARKLDDKQIKTLKGWMTK